MSVGEGVEKPASLLLTGDVEKVRESWNARMHDDEELVWLKEQKMMNVALQAMQTALT